RAGRARQALGEKSRRRRRQRRRRCPRHRRDRRDDRHRRRASPSRWLEIVGGGGDRSLRGRATGMNGSWAVALLATVAVGAGVAFALRPGSLGGGLPSWAGLVLPYIALTALATRRLGRKGVLRPLLRFRPGDPSLGILFGAAM